MTCELLSFGLLSRWIKDLKSTAVQKKIAKTYQLPPIIIPSLLQHLAYIRNICAHHGRLWNKQMVVTTQLPRNKPAGLNQNFNLAQPKKLYNTLVLIFHLLNTIDPSNTFNPQLTQLLTNHQINTSEMGFPTNWQQLPIWKP
jgi:abortive infection bacteriophage resistance protein